MITEKAGHGNFYKVEGILIVNKLTGRKNKRLMQRLKLFKWTLITVMLALLLNASAGPVYSARASISGTYTTSKPDFFDFAIEYNVTGASAKNREPDKIGSFNAHRTYNDVWVDPNVSSIRVHGTAYGRQLTGLSAEGVTEYPGKITVSVSCGKEKKEIPISIPVGSSPPYSFDVSIPVPAGSEGQPVNFNITAGMLWPNGYFNISVIGNGGFDSKTVPVTGIKITKRPPNLQLRVGETFQLQAQVIPEDATNKKIWWDAELSKNIIEINTETGLITGLKPGKVGVWAYSDEDNKIRDVIMLEVYELEAMFHPEELNSAPFYIGVNSAGTEEAYVSIELDLPPDRKNQFVADWTSSNTELVNVESIDNGRKAKVIVNSLTPQNHPGLNTVQGDSVEVTLDVSINAGLHGSINTTFPVTVSYVAVDWIRINPDKEGAGREFLVSYDPNPAKVDQLTMTVIIYPEDATNPAIRWHLYNHSLGTIIEHSMQETTLASATFIPKPVLPGRHKTIIIVESVSNPEVGDFIDLYVQNIHQEIPKDFRESPIGEVELTEEHKELMDRVLRETISSGDSLARQEWLKLQWLDKGLDYVPYKGFFNALRELFAGNGGNFLKEFAGALFGNAGVQFADHSLQFLFGDDYAEDLLSYFFPRKYSESR